MCNTETAVEAAAAEPAEFYECEWDHTIPPWKVVRYRAMGNYINHTKSVREGEVGGLSGFRM